MTRLFYRQLCPISNPPGGRWILPWAQSFAAAEYQVSNAGNLQTACNVLISLSLKIP
jgi:hypothetical protein